MGDTPRLTSKGSATALRSSAPALLHALTTCHSADEALYLNQARAKYLGGVFELDAALHLLHPPEEDLEMMEVTMFLEGAGEAPPRARRTSPVYDKTRQTPLYAIVCHTFAPEPAWCPALPAAFHMPPSLALPLLSPPLSGNRGAHHRGLARWQQHPGTPLLPLVVAACGDQEQVPVKRYRGASQSVRPSTPETHGTLR